MFVCIWALTLRVDIPLFIVVMISLLSSDQMSWIFCGWICACKCWSGTLDTFVIVCVLLFWWIISKLLVEVVTTVSVCSGGACSLVDEEETSCIWSGTVGCSFSWMSFKTCCLLDAWIRANCSSAVSSVGRIEFCHVASVFKGHNCIFWNLNILSVISLFSLVVAARPRLAF